jgi:hypothetical protein
MKPWVLWAAIGAGAIFLFLRARMAAAPGVTTLQENAGHSSGLSGMAGVTPPSLPPGGGIAGGPQSYPTPRNGAGRRGRAARYGMALVTPPGRES